MAALLASSVRHVVALAGIVAVVVLTGSYFHWDSALLEHDITAWNFECSVVGAAALTVAQSIITTALLLSAASQRDDNSLGLRARLPSAHQRHKSRRWLLSASLVAAISSLLLVAKVAVWRGNNASRCPNSPHSLSGLALLIVSIVVTCFDAILSARLRSVGVAATVCGPRHGEQKAQPLLGMPEQVRDTSQKEDTQRASMARMARLARPEVPLLLLGSLALVVSTGTTLAIPSFIGGIINLVNTSRSMHDLNKTTLALVVVLAINAVATTIRGTLFTLAGERVVARLRKALFQGIVIQVRRCVCVLVGGMRALMSGVPAGNRVL